MIDHNMAPNTMMPMTTQIQKMVMCRSNTAWLTSVAPGDMFTVQAAFAGLKTDHNNSPIHRCGCRIAVFPLAFLVRSPVYAWVPAMCTRGRFRRLASSARAVGHHQKMVTETSIDIDINPALRRVKSVKYSPIDKWHSLPCHKMNNNTAPEKHPLRFKGYF